MYRKHYQSVEEFRLASPSPKNTDIAEDQFSRASSYWNRGWMGASSPEEAEEALMHGWPEGTQRMRRALGSLSLPRVASVRRHAVWSDQGDEIDIHRVYAGGLDQAWRTTRRETVAGRGIPTVRIMVRIGGTSEKTPDELFWAGACACALADALEESGRSVEIIGYSFYTMGDSRGLITIQLKGECEPLDVDRLAALTAHAAAFRWWVFKARTAESRRISPGMGRTIDEIDPPMDRENDLTFVIRGVYSLDAARAFLTQATDEMEA